MRVSERGQIPIPERLRERFGPDQKVEAEVTPTEGRLPIHRRAAARHPVEEVYGFLGRGENTDHYIEEIRGR